MRAGLLALGILAGATGTHAAGATTLTQTVTNRADIALSRLSDDGTLLVPTSFLAANFRPFVGAGLNFVFLDVNFTFSGTATTSEGDSSFTVDLTFDLSLDVYNIGGILGNQVYNSTVASTIPINLVAADSFDVLGSTDPSLIAYFTGSGPVSFTIDPFASIRGTIQGDGTRVTGAVTSSEVLTYDFSGDGALLDGEVAVPEPASFALLGIGLLAVMRTRRRH